MKLAVLIKNGSLEGQSFPITDGATIGRKKAANVTVSDSKMSGIHAYFEFSAQDGWFLKDNGSTNKIIFQKERIDELLISHGTSFYLGKTLFEIVDQKSLLSQPWQNLMDLVAQSRLTVRNEATKVTWFKPTVELSFEQGAQYGTKWTLEYGPRDVGARVFDLQIEDEFSPDHAFQIAPTDDGPLFTTRYPLIVKVNGQGVTEAVLSNGDTISVKENILKVTLKDV